MAAVRYTYRAFKIYRLMHLNQGNLPDNSAVIVSESSIVDVSDFCSPRAADVKLFSALFGWLCNSDVDAEVVRFNAGLGVEQLANSSGTSMSGKASSPSISASARSSALLSPVSTLFRRFLWINLLPIM